MGCWIEGFRAKFKARVNVCMASFRGLEVSKSSAIQGSHGLKAFSLLGLEVRDCIGVSETVDWEP